jgi:hypothetical protein
LMRDGLILICSSHLMSLRDADVSWWLKTSLSHSKMSDGLPPSCLERGFVWSWMQPQLNWTAKVCSIDRFQRNKLDSRRPSHLYWLDALKFKKKRNSEIHPNAITALSYPKPQSSQIDI